MIDNDDQLALVRKTKPAWQAGRLNGIGGKIEDGEPPLAAMCREWKEETGHTYDHWDLFATIVLPDATVYFFKAIVEQLPLLWNVNDSGEPLEVHRFADVVRRTDMIQNLKWLLPLAFEDPDGFKVNAELPAA
jgi:8-oxo-dGTP diphosphatase